jgi:predicted RNA-binding protein with PUA domain
MDFQCDTQRVKWCPDCNIIFTGTSRCPRCFHESFWLETLLPITQKCTIDFSSRTDNTRCST